MIVASSAFNTANLSLNKKPIYAILIDGYNRIFSTQMSVNFGGVDSVPWIVSITDHAITINDLDGGADLADLVFNVQDRGGAITSDFPSFTFEGKKVSLLAGFPGMSGADFVTLFTGKLDSIESANANSEYVFTCPDVRQELTKVIYGVSDNGLPTDSNNPRTLNGNPLDILIAALINEVGLAASDIDLAKISLYRNTVYAGAQMQFSITSPPGAKDFIENEIMKPLGAYIWPNNLGQVSVNFYYPQNSTPVFDFNENNLIEIPEAGPADLINEVNIRFDYDSSDSPQAEIVRQDASSVSKFGLFGQHIIEAKGLRSGFQGALLGAFTAFLIFLRYGFKQLMFGSSNSGNGNAAPLNAIWSACLVEPGDIVTLTHAQVPDRINGVIGVSGMTFVVMDRTWQFLECLVQFKLLAVDLLPFRQFQIAPNGEASYVSAPGADQNQFMFLSNDTDVYSNSRSGNTLS